jgi:hypothetical protein
MFEGVVGGVIGALIGVVTKEAVDWVRRPRIQLEVQDREPFRVEVAREYPRGEAGPVEPGKAVFLRCRVTNVGRRTAKACCVFVREARRQGFSTISYGNPLALHWAGYEQTSIDLPPGIPHFVDVAVSESRAINGLHWRFVTPMSTNSETTPLFEFVPGGSNRVELELVAACDGSPSAALAAGLEWGEAWQTLRWMPGWYRR